MTYSVNTWSCTPHTEDGCNTGKDFDNIAAAKACYNDPAIHFKHSLRGTWLELTGPKIHLLRRDLPEVTDEDVGAWLKEIATQAGMGFGITGYNEVMGYE